MGSFIDLTGMVQQINLDATIYREAADNNMSVPQLLSVRYETDEQQYGSVFAQLLASEGVFMEEDRGAGIHKTKLSALLDPRSTTQAGVIVRDATPTSRILFPAIVLEVLENRLRDDTSGYAGIFNGLIAQTDSIDGPRWEQPILDYTRPASARTQPITQLAEPATMMTLTVSDTARTIPSFALGLTMSEQALRATTLDFVTLSLARQAEAEMAERIDRYINLLVTGDLDFGISPLQAVKANSFDPAITANGQLTHKAWIKWLRAGWKKRSIDWIMCDIDTYLIIESRQGKPTVKEDNPTSPRVDALPSIANAMLGNVQAFIVEAGVLPAGMIVGLDTRYAIRKVRNVQAEYRAAEDLVMRRGQAMRFDWGEMITRLYDDAWSVLSLTI